MVYTHLGTSGCVCEGEECVCAKAKSVCMRRRRVCVCKGEECVYKGEDWPRTRLAKDKAVWYIAVDRRHGCGMSEQIWACGRAGMGVCQGRHGYPCNG